jgi:hypothetical protein
VYKTLIFSAVFALLGCVVHSSSHADEREFHLRAWPPKQVVSRAEKALLHLDLANPRGVTETLCFDSGSRDHAEFDSDIHIHDSAGHVPRLTEYGEKIFHSIQFVSVQCQAFGAQQVRPETIALNSIYILEPNHTYTVWFTGKRLGTIAPVNSNWVTVTVK